MSGHERPGRPADWIEEDGRSYCLACRRDLAGEAAVSSAPADTPLTQGAKLRTRAKIDFEVRRDPSRSNAEIAHAIRSSVVAVQKARDRLAARPA
jgi:hypothetical protein